MQITSSLMRNAVGIGLHLPHPPPPPPHWQDQPWRSWRGYTGLVETWKMGLHCCKWVAGTTTPPWRRSRAPAWTTTTLTRPALRHCWPPTRLPLLTLTTAHQLSDSPLSSSQSPPPFPHLSPTASRPSQLQQAKRRVQDADHLLSAEFSWISQLIHTPECLEAVQQAITA